MTLARFVAELRHRHVIRVAVAYAVVAWLVVEVSATVAPELGLPGWTTRFVLVAALLGFPAALVLSWLFDVNPTKSGEGHTLPRPAGNPPDPRRIAVLPFSSYTPTRDDDYFADGITEELTSVISRVSGLEVIARTSVMPYRTDPKPVSVIAGELRVGTLLEGSIRRAGNRVRVTVQLIDTASEAHIWSEDYDRDLTDIFAIQSDVARAVANALRVRLLAEERERIEKVPTRDLEAHDLYLLGRHHLLKRNNDSLFRAIDLFEQALSKDPSFALAAAGLGEAWLWASIGYVANPPADAGRRARAAAEEAVRLDGSLSEPHTALGLIANMQSDPDAAWPALQRAVELNPSSAAAHQALASYWIMRGNFQEQLRCIERALALDPKSASIRLEAGWPHAYMRRYDRFLQRAKEALELDPDYALAHFNVGNALDALGDSRAAMEAYERTLELGGLWGYTHGFMVRSLLKLGEDQRAAGILRELAERASRETGLCVPLAIAYDASGDAEAAVAWLERGYAREEPGARWLHLEGFLPYENTREHPRFQALKEKEDRRLGRAAMEIPA